MEMAYEGARNILSVKWSDELSVESSRFFQTIVSLFAVIQERKVTNLMIDSGIPAGGVLTEEIIEYFIQHIPHTPLKNIAILESPDYLWDNNLYQVISLLITSYQLPIGLKLVKSRASGQEWFARPVPSKPPKKKKV
ncbi:hypothetical protein GCM10023188_26800 [Pontibacter saemangeumensis]|uniref:Uncharacterized protein n=2 Tax=Pontibacter saemangeumensis TaxID=1084525 RepID=A0ABP8LTS3_9BACT